MSTCRPPHDLARCAPRQSARSAGRRVRDVTGRTPRHDATRTFDVIGIDVSVTSIEHTKRLARTARYRQSRRSACCRSNRSVTLDRGLRPRRLHGRPAPPRRPARRPRALREVLAPDGAITLMVYARYGRTGISLMQEYCERFGVTPTRTSSATSSRRFGSCRSVTRWSLLRDYARLPRRRHAGRRALEPPRPRLHRDRAVRPARRSRPDVRAVGPSGPVPARLRIDQRDATRRPYRPAPDRRAVRRARTVPRHDRPPHRDRVRRRRIGGSARLLRQRRRLMDSAARHRRRPSSTPPTRRRRGVAQPGAHR